MKQKTLLTIAILLALPFGAWADTLTITNDDKQHIASTAYVKGAYNDAITEVNTKLDKFDQEITNHLVTDDDAMSLGLGELAAQAENIDSVIQEVEGPGEFNGITIPSTSAVLKIVNDASAEIMEDIDDMDTALVARINELESGVYTALNNKRVEIYTTWDNDNAKRQVAFVNASAQGQ